MFEDKGAFVRAHLSRSVVSLNVISNYRARYLLCCKEAFPRNMEDRKLALAVLHRRRPKTNMSQSKHPSECLENTTYVVPASVGVRSSSRASLRHFHDAFCEAMSLSRTCTAGVVFGQSAGRCWPRSVMGSTGATRWSCIRENKLSEE